MGRTSICEFDLDTSNHDEDDGLRGDADDEEEMGEEEADGLDGTQDAEIIIPRKRAQISNIPSHVPIIVSITNLSTQQKKRTK